MHTVVFHGGMQEVYSGVFPCYNFMKGLVRDIDFVTDIFLSLVAILEVTEGQFSIPWWKKMAETFEVMRAN
jgi:hypothetical protein